MLKGKFKPTIKGYIKSMTGVGAKQTDNYVKVIYIKFDCVMAWIFANQHMDLM